MSSIYTKRRKKTRIETWECCEQDPIRAPATYTHTQYGHQVMVGHAICSSSVEQQAVTKQGNQERTYRLNKNSTAHQYHGNPYKSTTTYPCLCSSPLVVNEQDSAPRSILSSIISVGFKSTRKSDLSASETQVKKARNYEGPSIKTQVQRIAR